MNWCCRSVSLPPYILPLIIALTTSPALAVSPEPQQASAEDDAQAKRYYQNGTTLYEGGAYADSIVAFKEAYRLSGRHALLYNIASAQERLGDLSGAIESLSRYRIHADPDEQATLGRRIDNLKDRLSKQQPTQPSEPTTPQIKTASVDSTEAIASPPRKPLSIVPLLYATAGLSGMALSSGTYFSVTANAYHDELENLCRGTLCPSTAESISASEAETRQMATVSWSIGLISGTAAIAIWAWETHRKEESKP